MVDIKFKKVYSDAILPKRMREGDSGLDLCAYEDATVAPGAIKLVSTGVSVELPQDYEAQVRPRSGMALRHGITVLNTPGTVDSNYRGEICVILINLGKEEFIIKKNDRIAQLVIMQLPKINITETGTLSKTIRGEAGFGSTDK